MSWPAPPPPPSQGEPSSEHAKPRVIAWGVVVVVALACAGIAFGLSRSSNDKAPSESCAAQYAYGECVPPYEVTCSTVADGARSVDGLGTIKPHERVEHWRDPNGDLHVTGEC